MGSESNLKTWVSDQLMTLLGYSQTTVVQYVIGLAKQASSPADVLGKLVDFGLSSSSETRAFAEEVFSRVPRKAASMNLYQKQEREAAMFARKQSTYALLDADDDDEDYGNNASVEKRSSGASVSDTKKADTHKKRLRKKTEIHDDDEEDEPPVQFDEGRRVKRRTSHDQEGGSESEEERERDQREREQLEQNIRERDAAGTRKLAEPKLTRKEEGMLYHKLIF
ncbi:hypothetical protein CRG98_001577 [Punica granatum]|uniref:PWI domain-containing protein n=1 Tax=Punica granatum TaxID=22663 RepID=A0A2I0LBA2_PUNGR|nr:hypothetical protein CRG98_001577 [Punica granatum]